jgi:hypothetical protein
MKRLMLVFWLFILASGSVVAQDEPEWRFGLRVQPSVSWFGTSLKEFENGKPKLNFGYGLMIEKSMFKSAVLATGIFVNDFGGTFNYVGQDKQINFKGQNDSILFTSRKLMLKYVEIPITLKFRTPEINYITYHAHFGVDMGFRVKATADESFRYFSSSKMGSYEDEDIRNDVSFLKMGLDVGIGGEYSIAGSTSLTLGVSYINGFTNVTRKNAELLIYSDDSKVKQIFYGHTILLSVGVLF